jgi:molybdopterin/thiamine biosynthesis adenylyltransferase
MNITAELLWAPAATIVGIVWIAGPLRRLVRQPSATHPPKTTGADLHAAPPPKPRSRSRTPRFRTSHWGDLKQSTLGVILATFGVVCTVQALDAANASVTTDAVTIQRTWQVVSAGKSNVMTWYAEDAKGRIYGDVPQEIWSKLHVGMTYECRVRQPNGSSGRALKSCSAKPVEPSGSRAVPVHVANR